MRNNSDLYELISSLSASEKRYFRMYANQQQSGEEKNYMKVFDLLERSDGKNEAELVAQIADAKLKRQFPVQKSYLYKLILKALRNYHHEQSVDFMLKEQLMNVEILMRRDLVRQAGRQLSKAKKLALDHEKYEYLLEINASQINLVMKTQDANLERLEKELERLYQEAEDHFSDFRQIQSYRQLSLRLLVLNRREQRARSDESQQAYARVLEHPLLQPGREPTSVRARFFYLQTLFIYHFALNQLDQSFRYVQAITELMESHDYLIREKPENYANSFQNLTMVASLVKPPAETLQLLHKLRSFQERNPKIRFGTGTEWRIQLFAHNLELHLRLEIGDLEGIRRHLPTVRAMLDSKLFAYNVNEGFILIDLFMHVARAYWRLGQAREALRFVNKVLNQEGVSGQYEVWMNARILQLLLLFELQEEQLLEYSVLSFYRFLRQRKRLLKFEKAILQFIRKAAQQPGRKEVQALFLNLRDTLAQLKDDPSEPLSFQHAEILDWLNRQLEGQIR